MPAQTVAAVIRVSAAVAFLLSGAAVVIAAVLPQLYPVWGTPWADVLDVLAANVGVWQFDTVLFLASAMLALVGAGLAFWPGRDALAPLWGASLLVLTVGTVLWATNLTFRLTVVVAAAQSGELGADPWFPVAADWVAGVWRTAAVLIIAGIVGLGVALLVSRRLARWVGWTTLALAAVSAIIFAVLQDMPPVVVYLPVLPWGIALLLPSSHADARAPRP